MMAHSEATQNMPLNEFIGTFGLLIVGGAGTLLGGGYVNRFNYFDRSYKVIPQLGDKDRATVDPLLDLKIKTPGGQLIPVSTFTHIETSTAPRSLNRFQQRNSVRIFGGLKPGVTKEDGLRVLEDAAQAQGARYRGERSGGLGDAAGPRGRAHPPTCLRLHLVQPGEGQLVLRPLPGDRQRDLQRLPRRRRRCRRHQHLQRQRHQPLRLRHPGDGPRGQHGGGQADALQACLVDVGIAAEGDVAVVFLGALRDHVDFGAGQFIWRLGDPGEFGAAGA